MAFYTAYIDESGTDEASPFMGIGGVLASAENWAMFESNWKRALDESGMRYSHMKEFAQSQGEFRKWYPPKDFKAEREKFSKDILDALVGSVTYSFGAVITKNHYEKIVPADLRKTMGTPYTFLARYCMIRAGLWAQDHTVEPINLIFGRGQPMGLVTLQHNLLLAHEQIRKEFHLGILTFGDAIVKERPSEAMLPLQGADVVAYELVKNWRDTAGKTGRNRRYAITRLQSLPHDWNKLTALDIGREVMIWNATKERARLSGHLDEPA